jgi:hypothetical protein
VHEKDIWNDAAMVDAPVSGKNPGDVLVAENTRIPTHYHHSPSHASATPEQNASWTANGGLAQQNPSTRTGRPNTNDTVAESWFVGEWYESYCLPKYIILCILDIHGCFTFKIKNMTEKTKILTTHRVDDAVCTFERIKFADYYKG